MKLQRYFIFCLIVFSFISQARSENVVDLLQDGATLTPATSRINKISIEGNTKTKKRALLRVTRIAVGDTLDQDRIVEVKDRLAQNPQYILKELTFDQGSGELKIVIEDKWSLIPIPMITQSGYFYSRGFLIYENNFLGELATFVPAIAWTNSGLQWILGYKDESLFGDDIGFKAILLNKSDLTKFQRKENTLFTFESRLKALLLSPNWNYKKHVFKGGVVIFDKDVYNEREQQIFNYSRTALQFRYHYNEKNFTKSEVYYTGYYITYNFFSVLNSLRHKNVALHDAQLETSTPVGENFINLNFLYRAANDSSYLYPDLLGGKEGFRGYDSSSLPSYRYGSFMAQYQQKVWNRLYSDLFYELTTADLIDDVRKSTHISRLTEHTVGIGFRYYFKKITIPALVTEYARNLTDRSDHFHFNLGLSL